MNVKAFLEANEVYFRTGATALLSIAAIAVSVAQYFISVRQTEILELQTKVAEVGVAPRLELNLLSKPDAQTGQYNEAVLTISNHGGAVHEFSSRVAYFLNVQVFYFDSGKTVKKEIDIPINGYFSANKVSSSGTGLLSEREGAQNKANFIRLYRSIYDAAKSMGMDHAFIEQRVVAHLSYRDLLQRQQVEFLEVRELGGGLKLPDSTGRDFFALWDKGIRPELAELQIAQLLEIARSQGKQN